MAAIGGYEVASADARKTPHDAVQARLRARLRVAGVDLLSCAATCLARRDCFGRRVGHALAHAHASADCA